VTMKSAPPSWAQVQNGSSAGSGESPREGPTRTASAASASRLTTRPTVARRTLSRRRTSRYSSRMSTETSHVNVRRSTQPRSRRALAFCRLMAHPGRPRCRRPALTYRQRLAGADGAQPLATAISGRLRARRDCQARKLEEGHWAVELHEDIDIAVGAQLPARSGAEDPETAHRVGVQFREMARQNGEDFGRVGHGVAMPVVRPAPKRGSLAFQCGSGGGKPVPRPPLSLHDWG
jgi:hypothetical protein